MAKRSLYFELKMKQGLTCPICKRSMKKEWEEYEAWVDLMTKKQVMMRAGLSTKGMVRRQKRTTIDLSIDHIIPRSLGGSWDMSNLQLVHHHCNLNKGSKLLDEEELLFPNDVNDDFSLLQHERSIDTKLRTDVIIEATHTSTDNVAEE